MKPSIYYPVRPFHVNQPFGANEPCVKNMGLPTQDIIIPLVGPGGAYICPTGYDKLYPHFGMAGHNGTDLMAKQQPVYAALPGKVVEKQSVPARGLGVGILSDEEFDFPEGKFYVSIRYWHLKEIDVEVGSTVHAGDVIGLSDNTGFSSGNHLHFEGVLYRKDGGQHPIVAFPDNGYYGAVNLEPYFNGIYADVAGKMEAVAKLNALADKASPVQARILRAVAGVIKAFWL